MSLEQLERQVPSRVRRDVALLRWPDQQELRDHLAADGLPRLLLISSACGAPVCADELEDWIREPLDADELEARTSVLEHRARHRTLRPRIDSSNLVRLGSRWIDFPPIQLPVVRLLVSHFGRVVPAEEIQAVYLTAGGSVHPKAVNAMISRVKRRLAELDLTLTNVRDRGYLLEGFDGGIPEEPLQIIRQE